MATATNKILWLSLCVSQVIYIVVVFAKPATPRASGVPDLMFLALFAIAVGTGLGTVIFRRRALVAPIRSGELDPNTPVGAARAFTPFILNLVLSESVAIYGLVLSFLSNDPKYVVGFVAGALVLMYIHRPTARDLVAPLSAGYAGAPPPI